MCCITSSSCVGGGWLPGVAVMGVGEVVGLVTLVGVGVTRLDSGWVPLPSGLPRLAKGSFMGRQLGTEYRRKTVPVVKKSVQELMPSN